MDQRRRIAVYGGTFDPVHFGHLSVAKNVVDLFEMDQLLFVPARQAPHKVEREVSAAIHRFAMLALATQNDEKLLVSTIELDAPERRYTIETLKELKVSAADAELFFVMGADSWAEITTWREWQQLLRLTNHVVVTRPGYDLPLTDAVETIDVRGKQRSDVSSLLETAVGPRIYISDVAKVDISATEIRRAAREANLQELKAKTPSAVADYILKYKLYQDSNEN